MKDTPMPSHVQGDRSGVDQNTPRRDAILDVPILCRRCLSGASAVSGTWLALL